MEQSSYNIEDVYREFATIDDYFYVTEEGVFRVDTAHTSINDYCNSWWNQGKDNCHNHLEMTNCSVIYLLKTIKEKYKLEDDKLGEYVILWLSYKLNRKPQHKFAKLNDFYNSYIEKKECYNDTIKDSDNMTYKDIINKKKYLMDMNIKEISKFNGPFNILFYLYHLFHDEPLKCETNLKLAKEFVQKFQDLNKDSNNIKDISYNKLLSTLSNDYINLINKYGNKCTNFNSLPELNTHKSPVDDPVDISGKDSGQSTTLSPEVTSSSSSILNTVIPVLSTFSLISLFLGVAYKYSLFGINKLFQRQYIRKKLNQVKKKMKVNI
ncbi:PIR protein CIR protein [Plasmodium vinckei vinckei]|uniref:PIR protein CIR protein n=1 Tax=Plasmodium vinckei vinckei TaxID=54757 RepID=A0A449BZ30_PLAVN|nr:PIR protein CIR protein [Plasmodium vinckei vinckei]VEV58750.1 PIR protein CIR protein [Plasmodium vinckei vinckei]